MAHGAIMFLGKARENDLASLSLRSYSVQINYIARVTFRFGPGYFFFFFTFLISGAVSLNFRLSLLSCILIE